MESSSSKILGFIIFIAIVIGVAYLLQRTEDQQNQSQNQIQEVIYTNPDFGFRLILPTEWSNYKVSISKDIPGDVITVVYVLLPTTDANWSDYYVSETETLEGYVPMFTISIWRLEKWEDLKKSRDCQGRAQLGCPNERLVVGKNSKYVFTADRAQEYPVDLRKMIPPVFLSEFLQGKFELLSK